MLQVFLPWLCCASEKRVMVAEVTGKGVLECFWISNLLSYVEWRNRTVVEAMKFGFRILVFWVSYNDDHVEWTNRKLWRGSDGRVRGFEILKRMTKWSEQQFIWRLHLAVEGYLSCPLRGTKHKKHGVSHKVILFGGLNKIYVLYFPNSVVSWIST